jgi:hypothetical protein
MNKRFVEIRILELSTDVYDTTDLWLHHQTIFKDNLQEFVCCVRPTLVILYVNISFVKDANERYLMVLVSVQNIKKFFQMND